MEGPVDSGDFALFEFEASEEPGSIGSPFSFVGLCPPEGGLRGKDLADRLRACLEFLDH
jgi:hypothetical protein